MSRSLPRRLFDLAEALQSGGGSTAAELALRLGVSERTVRRDIARLRELDMPVEGRPGRYGGVSLEPGALLPAVRFTDDELLALVTGLGSVAVADENRLGRAARSALDRLHAVMPAGTRDRVVALQEATDFEGVATGATAPSEHVFTLAKASRERTSVDITYRGPNGDTRRRIDPYGIARLGNWYLAAYCHLRQALRTFRLDRIGTVRVTTERFQRPAGFDTLREVARSIALAPFNGEVECRALLHADIATVSRHVTLTDVALDQVGDAVRLTLRCGEGELRRVVWHLLRFPFPVTIEAPAGLVAEARAVASRAAALAAGAALTSAGDVDPQAFVSSTQPPGTAPQSET